MTYSARPSLQPPHRTQCPFNSPAIIMRASSAPGLIDAIWSCGNGVLTSSRIGPTSRRRHQWADRAPRMIVSIPSSTRKTSAAVTKCIYRSALSPSAEIVRAQMLHYKCYGNLIHPALAQDHKIIPIREAA